MLLQDGGMLLFLFFCVTTPFFLSHGAPNIIDNISVTLRVRCRIASVRGTVVVSQLSTS